MKSLVLWSSRTGNTKAVAHAIYEALPGEKEIGEEGRISDFPAMTLFCGILGIPEGRRYGGQKDPFFHPWRKGGGLWYRRYLSGLSGGP